MRHPSTRLASLAILAALLFPVVGRGAPACPEWPVMPAEEYWHHSMVVRNLRTESETYQFLCVVRQLDEGQDRHRVDKHSLLDLEIKETAFRQGVARSVNFLRRQREHLENGHLRDLRDWHFNTLERLTGVKLNSIQEWSDWFDANHERLRLSPDGERLIVSSDDMRPSIDETRQPRYPGRPALFRRLASEAVLARCGVSCRLNATGVTP